jgi:Cu/Ag efflux protein CusF
MKTLLLVLLAAAFVLCACAAFPAMDMSKPTVLGGGIVAQSVQTTAKVTAVDRAKGTVTLETPNGKMRTFKVHKNVKNLAVLKKGDKITATLVDAMAVTVDKGGPKPGITETTMVTIRPKGMGAIVANTIRVIGKIQYVDPQNRTVTLTGPSGKSMTFKVNPSVKNLSKLKAGDDVVVRYFEALAINLQKPKM